MSTLIFKHIFLLIYLTITGFLFINVGGNESMTSYSIWSRPEFWPRTILIGLSLTVLMKLYLPRNKLSSKSTIKETITLLFKSRIIIGILGVSAYCYSTQYLGFAFATMAFLCIFMWYLGQKNLKSLIIIPVISVFLILFVFWRILYVSLPKGSGFFLDFSNLILTIVRTGAS
jgi:hypothetical protein